MLLTFLSDYTASYPRRAESHLKWVEGKRLHRRAICQADIRKEKLLLDLKENGRISSDTQKT
jgi:hypothetical protein